MNLMALFQSILYGISTALLYPVIVSLLALFGYVVILLGRFLSEFIQRETIRKNFDADHLVALLEKSMSTQALTGLSITPSIRRFVERIIAEYHREKEDLDIRLETLLQEEELRLHSELKKIGMVVRFGPALGLMGTLIPMGTALHALSQGNLELMASNLIIAFTTTVVGLASGIGAYLLSLVKDHWLREDIRQMEYVTEILMRKIGSKPNVEIPEKTQKDFWEAP